MPNINTANEHRLLEYRKPDMDNIAHTIAIFVFDESF
jgi:hypothetical protein